MSKLTFAKDWKTYPPIPEVARAKALKLFENGGPLHRYHGASEITQFEEEVAAYINKKFAVAVNSCGSAIFIALKALGVKPNDPVLSNALTFQAVPSSIVHAGATPIYVECTDSLVIDIDDLAYKAKLSGAKVLVLSHMRGKVCDLDHLYRYCRNNHIQVIEDCAHALGCKWEGQHVGAEAAISCFSFQSHKVLNAGEGGLLATSDPDLAAQAFLYSGCFETLYQKHTVRPPDEYFRKWQNKLPNYSLRMTNLAAAILLPQFHQLENRIEAFNKRFDQISQAIGQLPGVKVVQCHPKARSLNDCIQFHVPFTHEQALAFVQQCRERGILIALLGASTNARNFRTWQFAEVPDLPQTEQIISAVCDLSLPAVFDDRDWQIILSILSDVYLQIFDSISVEGPVNHVTVEKRERSYAARG